MIFEKYKPVAKQFIKYFGVALIGYIFDFGSLVVLTEVFHVYYLIAASTGFVLGLIVTYILSGRYVFGKSKIKKRYVEFIIFAAIGLVGLGILNLLMWIFTEKLGIYYILSKVIATVFVYMWNFFARRAIYQEK
ncbi:MAG: polysaccharide synthesis protein GtrA [Candidatus Saccharibacteria bacterium]|nr:polysaccharide synthesis protein GtrA [Candidatus Saccharibacteria bacterium]